MPYVNPMFGTLIIFTLLDVTWDHCEANLICRQHMPRQGRLFVRDAPLDFKGGAGSLGQDKFFFPPAWQGKVFIFIFIFST